MATTILFEHEVFLITDFVRVQKYLGAEKNTHYFRRLEAVISTVKKKKIKKKEKQYIHTTPHTFPAFGGYFLTPSG